MSIAVLNKALKSVPFHKMLNISVEETKPGHVVLRLAYNDQNTNHSGTLHSAAVFAVGELAATVALGTHPELSQLQHLQKCTKIKYILPSSKDITAHATVTEEMVQAIQNSLASGNAQVEIPVKVLDGHGTDVAELMGIYAFRRGIAATPAPAAASPGGCCGRRRPLFWRRGTHCGDRPPRNRSAWHG